LSSNLHLNFNFHLSSNFHLNFNIHLNFNFHLNFNIHLNFNFHLSSHFHLSSNFHLNTVVAPASAGAFRRLKAGVPIDQNPHREIRIRTEPVVSTAPVSRLLPPKPFPPAPSSTPNVTKKHGFAP
jgi:hypothetical protein